LKRASELNKIAWIFLATVGLSGCATPEFKQAKSECSADAFRNYPVQLVPTWVTKTRAIQVPTGQSHCTTVQMGNVSNTSCQQVMRTDFVPYQENVMVDVNAASRETVMNQCAAQLCSSRYGNPECKTK
jgi:hypothetical protein